MKLTIKLSIRYYEIKPKISLEHNGLLVIFTKLLTIQIQLGSTGARKLNECEFISGEFDHIITFEKI
jgi:hypothetical protein